MDEATPEPVVKAGYRTSEYGALAAYGVLVAINRKAHLEIDNDTLMMLGGAVTAYIAQRGWVKR